MSRPSATDLVLRLRVLAPTVLSLLAGCGIVLQLVAIGHTLVRREIRIEPAPVFVVPPVSIDLGVLEGARLFGSAALSRVAEEHVAEGPETNLNLTLAGVLVGAGDWPGQAIIAEPNGRQRLYRIGDEVAGGNARLVAVRGDSVLLGRAGTTEVLRLPQGTGADTVASTRDKTVAAAEASSSLLDPRSLAANRARLRSVLWLTPNLQDGELAGFSVMPGHDRSGFESSGLVASDVITAVNGEALVDPSDGARLLTSLSQGAPVRFTVLRDGALRDVAVTIPGLNSFGLSHAVRRRAY